MLLTFLLYFMYNLRICVRLEMEIKCDVSFLCPDRSLASVIKRIGSDARCEVHQMVLGSRDEKNSWFHQYSPSQLACSDDFELWGIMVSLETAQIRLHSITYPQKP